MFVGTVYYKKPSLITPTSQVSQKKAAKTSNTSFHPCTVLESLQPNQTMFTFPKHNRRLTCINDKIFPHYLMDRGSSSVYGTGRPSCVLVLLALNVSERTILGPVLTCIYSYSYVVHMHTCACYNSIELDVSQLASQPASSRPRFLLLLLLLFQMHTVFWGLCLKVWSYSIRVRTVIENLNAFNNRYISSSSSSSVSREKKMSIWFGNNDILQYAYAYFSAQFPYTYQVWLAALSFQVLYIYSSCDLAE